MRLHDDVQRSADPVPSGVVLDEPLGMALLFSAYHEGLLPGDETVGDGFPRMLLDTRPPEHLIAAAYEQLMLGGQVYLPRWLPNEWHEPLAELRVFGVPYGDEPLVDVGQLDAEIIFGMLASRGVMMTLSEYQRHVHAHDEALRAWDAVAGDKPTDNVSLRLMIARATRQSQPYSDEQVAAWEELQRCYEPLRPVAECMEAYRRVVTTSLQLGALSSLPIAGARSGALPVPFPADTTDETQLLRISCRQLQRLPVPPTLAATIDVTASPEAAALRARLARWTAEVRSGNVDAAATIAADVDEARRELKTSRSMSRVGDLMTYLGVPLSIAGTLAGTPELAASGIAVASVGGVAVASRSVLERLNRWTMYGAS